MNPQLEIEDLLAGLSLFGSGRYHAVEVFADDLSEDAQRQVAPKPVIERNGKTFKFTVFAERGVVRLEVAKPSSIGPGAVVGAAVGTAAAAAAREKGEALLGGALLGLLVGGFIGAASDGNRPQRVFAMQFDPSTRQWRAYDGTLLRWMKERLLVPNPVET